MEYETEKEIDEVIENFKNCTIARGSWGHPEHLILAYHFSSNNDFDTAVRKMREGIIRLLESFEIDLTKEMPYHETMTIFWMRTVYDFVCKTDSDSRFRDVTEIIKRFDKDYPLRFYSKELLFSDKARKELVEPNLA